MSWANRDEYPKVETFKFCDLATPDGGVDGLPLERPAPRAGAGDLAARLGPHMEPLCHAMLWLRLNGVGWTEIAAAVNRLDAQGRGVAVAARVHREMRRAEARMRLGLPWGPPRRPTAEERRRAATARRRKPHQTDRPIIDAEGNRYPSPVAAAAATAAYAAAISRAVGTGRTCAGTTWSEDRPTPPAGPAGAAG